MTRRTWSASQARVLRAIHDETQCRLATPTLISLRRLGLILRCAGMWANTFPQSSSMSWYLTPKGIDALGWKAGRKEP